MKAQKSQKELIKELIQLIKEHPSAKVIFLVDNDEKCDPTMFKYTKHRIKEVFYDDIIETEEGEIYISISDFLDACDEDELEQVERIYNIYQAIVIITEADV